MKHSMIIKTIAIDLVNTCKCALNSTTLTKEQALFLVSSAHTGLCVLDSCAECLPEEYDGKARMVVALGKIIILQLAKKHDIDLTVITKSLESFHAESAAEIVSALGGNGLAPKSPDSDEGRIKFN